MKECGGVGRALYVVGRRLQGVRRRRAAVEDVARLRRRAGSGRGRGGGGGGAGWAGWAGAGRGLGRGGPGRAWRQVEGGMCQSYGNIVTVSKKLQTFRSKERARKEFVGKE